MAANIPCDFINLSAVEKEWKPVGSKNYDPSIKVLVLSDTLNHETRSGSKCMFMRMEKNDNINEISIHDNWEEVVIVQGTLIWLNDSNNNGKDFVIQTGGYVNRKPLIKHGPFKAGPDGCLMYVRHYYTNESTEQASATTTTTATTASSQIDEKKSDVDVITSIVSKPVK